MTLNHILVVDDDTEIRCLLGDYLRKNGYQVTEAGDGKAMSAILDKSTINLVVLDLMLPGDDGLVLCRNLRARSDIPVIILTARGDETDRIVGLEMGADDYLAKPFNPRELLARIKSVLRRTQVRSEKHLAEDNRYISFGEWTLDTVSRHLVAKDGLVVNLSGSEYRVLTIFLQHPNRVLQRDLLLDLTQGRETESFDRSIDILISRLRQRLGDDAKEPKIIKTVRGEGYVMAVPVNTA